jgi:predicted alpha/beta superfamily hydrolase
VYRLFISLPDSYSSSEKTYPVLYLVGGNFTFTVTRQTVEWLQVDQVVPELIIVGIGYPKPTGVDADAVESFFRDLTPSAEITPGEDGYPSGGGGADDFLDFVKGELIPFIDSNYRTDSNDRALVGFSRGGLFVLYTLFREPGLFTRMVSCSPTMQRAWGNKVIIESEKRYAQTHSSLPVRLFFALESSLDVVIDPKRIEAVQGLCEVLKGRNYEGFQFQRQVFEDEIHFSVFPASIPRALRWIYN